MVEEADFLKVYELNKYMYIYESITQSDHTNPGLLRKPWLKNDNINSYNELINIGIYHMVIKSTAPRVGL